MQCVLCNKDISASNKSSVCIKCKFDDNKMITYINVKRRYGLTEDEINGKGLFEIPTNSCGNVGRKFIIKDIEDLARKIYIDKPDTDKRKNKFFYNKLDLN